MVHLAGSTRWMQRGGLAIALMLLTTGCGPSKTAQCREMLQTVQDAEAQKVLGQQSVQARQTNRQLYQTLAADLAALDIRSKDLKPHQDRLVEAYEHMAMMLQNYLELSDEDGHIGYVRGDTEAEAAVNKVMAEMQLAYTRVDMALNLFYGACQN